MHIEHHGAAPNADRLMQALETYGLFRHVVELEAYGMTVVPPETMRSSPGFIERLRNAILRTCERRNGITLGDFRTATANPADVGRNSWDLLEEDEVFVEAATNPVLLALVRWLLGHSAVFSGQTWIIKGTDSRSLSLHSDAHGIPPGAGQIAHMCNASWLCTDYTDDRDGPTVFVPGSHKYGRATLPHEANLDTTAFRFIPLIAPAGSLAIWNGATWHGSVPRTRAGLRITLVQNYMRSYMRPQALYDRTLSPQLRAQHPELARMTAPALYPYEDPQGPDPARIAPFIRTGTDPFA